MPFSSREGKAELLERILSKIPKRILDVGTGAGDFADFLQGE